MNLNELIKTFEGIAFTWGHVALHAMVNIVHQKSVKVQAKISILISGDLLKTFVESD